VTTIEPTVRDALLGHAPPTALTHPGDAAARGVLRIAGRATGHVVHALWPLALVYVAWYAWVELKDLPPAVAPHPGEVVAYILDHPGSYVSDALNTASIVLLGLAVGTVAGVALATVSWFSVVARSAISAPTLITQCVPVATMVPLIARVFGYNQRTVVLIAALIAFFPVLVFTSAGLRATPPGTGDLFSVLGASRWQRFRLLAVPSGVPRLLLALRLSVVAAVVGAMLAQWIMGTQGLGYRLAVAQASFRTSEAWGASLVAVLVSVTLSMCASALCRAATRRFD